MQSCGLQCVTASCVAAGPGVARALTRRRAGAAAPGRRRTDARAPARRRTDAPARGPVLAPARPVARCARSPSAERAGDAQVVPGGTQRAQWVGEGVRGGGVRRTAAPGCGVAGEGGPGGFVRSGSVGAVGPPAPAFSRVVWGSAWGGWGVLAAATRCLSPVSLSVIHGPPLRLCVCWTGIGPTRPDLTLDR